MKQISFLLILSLLLGACTQESNRVTPDPVVIKPDDFPILELTAKYYKLGSNHTLVVTDDNEGIVVPSYVNGNLFIFGYDEEAFRDLNSLTGDTWKNKCGNYWSKLWPAVQKIKLLNEVGSYPKAEQLILEMIPNFEGKFFFSDVKLNLVLPTDEEAQILVSSFRGSLPKLKSVRAVNYSDLWPSVLSKNHGYRSLTNVLIPYYEVLLPSSSMQAVTFCDLLMGNLQLKTEFEGHEIYINVVESNRGFEPNFESSKGN